MALIHKKSSHRGTANVLDKTPFVKTGVGQKIDLAWSFSATSYCTVKIVTLLKPWHNQRVFRTQHF